MHFRFKTNYETVVPPLPTFSTRWIVHAPQNNIDEGDVGVGGFYKSSCAAIRKDIVVGSTDKYIKTKALAEKIIDRMALQSTPTFRVALEWMQGFFDALQGGDVPRFVMEATTSNVLTVLSQESSMSSTGLTQISYVNPSLATLITPPAQGGDDTLEEKRATPVQDASGEVHDVPEDEGLEASDPPDDVDVEAKLSSTSASRDTGSTPDGTELTQETPQEGPKTAPISFTPPPRVRGLSKCEKRCLAGGKELREARALAVKIRDGKKTRKARLDDVAALLDGAYSLDIAKAMVDTLHLDDIEVQGSISVRPYNVGQHVPKITRILQLDKIQEAITAIKATDNLNLLANWSDYGSATFDQLVAMTSVLEARNRFQLVQFTRIGLAVLSGRSRTWSHRLPTSATIQSKPTRKQYKGCGWVKFAWGLNGLLVARCVKKKTATGFGAMDPSNDRIIAVICLDHHWEAYLLDKRTHVCYTFDPLQLKGNLATLKPSVQCVIEPLLGLKNKVTYKEIDWCTQRDSSSCGIWCLVVLELLLAERPWADCLYEVQSYLRMRYLYKAIGVQQYEVVHERD
ncbi:hypothetical protein PRNP1_014465 [Phytophthora ramorum]